MRLIRGSAPKLITPQYLPTGRGACNPPLESGPPIVPRLCLGTQVGLEGIWGASLLPTGFVHTLLTLAPKLKTALHNYEMIEIGTGTEL